jgi:hypothetical protein
VPVPAVVRFVDGLVVAVERGTPLGDVLRAQAADVREQHKRDLIEAGGRREVLMLVPSSIGLVVCVEPPSPSCWSTSAPGPAAEWGGPKGGQPQPLAAFASF